jgi:hypothetical protein
MQVSRLGGVGPTHSFGLIVVAVVTITVSVVTTTGLVVDVSVVVDEEVETMSMVIFSLSPHEARKKNPKVAIRKVLTNL